MAQKTIPVAEPSLGKEELEKVVKALESGWISSKGEYIIEFEKGFAGYCGCEYGVATSNGTTALHLALSALGVKKGDEVLVPTLTFISTANAVAYTGAKPVFVDSHPRYWCMDPEKLRKKITEKTKAVIPVHLYGHPCDMDPIKEITEEHDLCIVEDAAEAHGAEYKGRKVGSFSDISCFSFYGNKIITTGEGGMCLTDDRELMEKMRILRDHGMDPGKKYWHDVIGFNYRMTNLQAAVGVAQLEKLDSFVEKKREIAALYNSLLQDSNVKLPPEEDWAKNVYWMYSILSEKRDHLIEKLREKGIESRPFFPPIHQQPCHLRREKMPVAERLSMNGLNLPSSVNLTEEEIKEIAAVILGKIT
ncbi:MAG: DegT/DnrJ/EryC1/StrS aminotransferase family protein [Candidatus Altiarchaeota archaeon]|nr:DegT/DnrJ/EryC1/StrS aminotransferase family protein [Candidatus Altiarchaeota archaeon]